MKIKVPISIGELFDKISILQIKREKIKEVKKQANLINEFKLLENAIHSLGDPEGYIAELKKVNEKLWGVEEEIRDCERRKDFSPRFIELARTVYITNDERSRIKLEINKRFNSSIQEEKSYQEYR